MDPIKFGVVGLATSHPMTLTELLEKHGFAMSFLAYDDTQDEENERAATLQQKYPGVQIVANAAAMVAAGVQATMCCTQAHRHLADCAALIEARVPCFLEKPLAPDYAQGKQILDLVRQHDAPFMTGSVRYFSPNYREVFAAIREGKIGTPLFVECFEPHGTRPGYWQDLKSASGGLAINYGIHVADPIVAALGPEVVAVHAFAAKQSVPMADSEDTAIFLAQFQSGAIGIGKACGGYHFGAGHPVPTVGHFIAHGTEGALETYLEPSDVRQYRGASFEHSAAGERRGGFPAAAAAFAEMVATGQRPMSIEHMDATMRLLDGARRSLDTGKAVSV